MKETGYQIRADPDGVVFVSAKAYISMLEISDSGKVIVLGNLTGQGELLVVMGIAIGPRPGHLCVAHSSHVYIVNITSDTITHRLAKPPGLFVIWSVAALPTGEILVADSQGHLACYRSVSDPAVLLTDTPVRGRPVLMLGNVNQFLLAPQFTSQLYVLDGEKTWHTVEALNGKDGVWVPIIMEVAIWHSCVWVGQLFGALVLMCPV